jgi:hypothetical protein
MTNANGLDYFNIGEPLQSLSGKVNTAGFDYFNLGEPFTSISSGVAGVVSQIKKFSGVARDEIGAAGTVAVASIKKIAGVSNA